MNQLEQPQVVNHVANLTLPNLQNSQDSVHVAIHSPVTLAPARPSPQTEPKLQPKVYELPSGNHIFRIHMETSKGGGGRSRNPWTSPRTVSCYGDLFVSLTALLGVLGNIINLNLDPDHVLSIPWEMWRESTFYVNRLAMARWSSIYSSRVGIGFLEGLATNPPMNPRAALFEFNPRRLRAQVAGKHANEQSNTGTHTVDAEESGTSPRLNALEQAFVGTTPVVLGFTKRYLMVMEPEMQQGEGLKILVDDEHGRLNFPQLDCNI